jgi:2-phospho-L-lactate/phosphoenolpyruvate guanylyltransferase
VSTTAIIPVKRFEHAKQRLADAVPPPSRAALAEAMLLDVLGALTRSKRVDAIIVVTSDPQVARTARWLGSEVLEQDRDDGHSEAATAGVHLALSAGADRVALLPGDCPMLDAEELDSHLGVVPRSALIVPDRHGTGTNGLLLSPPDAFTPAFGPDSCSRHVGRARDAGVSFAVERIDSLALDLDTPEDLAQLRDALILAPERAPRTAQMIWELGPEQSPSSPAAA